MKLRFPKAKLGKLDDGRLYWLLDFPLIASPISPDGVREWKVMMVYNSDHPFFPPGRYAGSVKTYPLSPSIDDMVAMYSTYRNRVPPHLLTDEFGNSFLCIEHNDNVVLENRRGGRVTCGADYAAQTARWLTAFELSLVDDAVFEKFNRHTDNN